MATQTEREVLIKEMRAAVAIISECSVMGQQTVNEIGGHWKFLRYGTQLFTRPRATHMRDDEIPSFVLSINGRPPSSLQIVRAVEARHGIVQIKSTHKSN